MLLMDLPLLRNDEPIEDGVRRTVNRMEQTELQSSSRLILCPDPTRNLQRNRTPNDDDSILPALAVEATRENDVALHDIRATTRTSPRDERDSARMR